MFLTRLRLKVMSLCSASRSTHNGSISPSHRSIFSHVTGAVCVDWIVFPVTARKLPLSCRLWLLWLSLFWDRDGAQLDIHWPHWSLVTLTQPWYTDINTWHHASLALIIYLCTSSYDVQNWFVMIIYDSELLMFICGLIMYQLMFSSDNFLIYIILMNYECML